jgi:hypothetical protein
LTATSTQRKPKDDLALVALLVVGVSTIKLVEWQSGSGRYGCFLIMVLHDTAITAGFCTERFGLAIIVGLFTFIIQ